MQTVTFDELDSTLAECEATVAAAEAHGTLCGALAAVPGYSAADWISDLLVNAGSEAEPRARELLTTLYGETHTALASGLMELEPLLPPDDLPLDQRTTALAEWCNGFLFGLGGGLPQAGGWPETVQEVVTDFSEIGRASVGDEETEETNEVAYAELVEYLRASAQLAYDDLVEHRAQGGAP
jgi:uncharacterized protein YgfB (UPF0149 family)